MKALLVGQDPAWLPTGEDRPAFVGSDSGERLARLAGLENSEALLAHFDLDNIFRVKLGAWDRYEAEARADSIVDTAYADRRGVVVFLGARARDAAGLRATPPFVLRKHVAYSVQVGWMPHPSGLSRSWNEEATRRAGGVFLRSLMGVRR